VSDDPDQIRAAGTLLWRPAKAAEASDPGRAPLAVEIGLVHRARREDWSLPKGKLEPGETWAGAAVRETREETGHAIYLGPPLPTQRYLVDGRPKIVRYWSARTSGDEDLVDGIEVDALDWLSPEEARERLSYEHDTTVIDGFLSVEEAVVDATKPTVDLAPDADVLVVLRHARAVKRAAWTGPDRERPLEPRGAVEANSLAPWLAAYGPDRVLSSDSTRCLDTVSPYATKHGLTIEHEPLFSEEGFASHRRLALARLGAVLDLGGRIVVCTHRPVLPSLLRHIAGRHDAAATLPLAPGGAVIVHHVRGQVLSLERHGPEDLSLDLA
jgi:phosphohistidine phosphatase SixA/ADP-ribose pyrophosphatase YjhB (NUDIX family)